MIKIISFTLFTFQIYFVNVLSELLICGNVKCANVTEICGVARDGAGYRLRLFSSECEFKKTQCSMQNYLAYETVPIHYCRRVFETSAGKKQLFNSASDTCMESDCAGTKDNVHVCTISSHMGGFRVRLFRNKCQLRQFNCAHQEQFNVTDFHICQGLEISDDGREDNNRTKSTDNQEVKTNKRTPKFNNLNDVETDKQKVENNELADGELYIQTNDELGKPYEVSNKTVSILKDGTVSEQLEKGYSAKNEVPNDGNFGNIANYSDIKSLVVIHGALRDLNRVNETISQFFAATHVFDVPVQEMPADMLESGTRRRIVPIAGPVRIYRPWITIPPNISEDHDHRPTLNSCYHKCPRKCPQTYAPVCGVPGRIAREPSLMFQNHCFMDVAQCKMQWENKSPTALSSAYQESSFVFCLGDVLNHMYNFLPLLKTLQHMGRLPKNKRYHQRLNNFKFFNNLLSIKDPRIMG